MTKPVSKTDGLYLKLIVGKQHGLNYTKIIGKNTTHSRSTIKMQEDKRNLTIEITAKDATALRASTNSILRDLQTIEGVSKIE